MLQDNFNFNFILNKHLGRNLSLFQGLSNIPKSQPQHKPFQVDFFSYVFFWVFCVAYKHCLEDMAKITNIIIIMLF